jgi:hypothetical protein
MPTMSKFIKTGGGEMKMHRLLIVAMGALCSLSPAVHAYQFGDLDGDGKIGIADSIASLQFSAGLLPLIAVLTKPLDLDIPPDPPCCIPTAMGHNARMGHCAPRDPLQTDTPDHLFIKNR